MPRMSIGCFNDRMELMNGIYQAEDRQDDGVHLTVAGGTKAATAVLTAVAEDRHLPPFTEER
jgi:hypothetical protein